MSRLANVARGLAAVAVMVMLLVGFPVAMARLVGWPLPTSVPSLDGMRDVLETGDVPAQLVVNVLAVIAWLLWAQLAYAIAVEAIWAARGQARRTLRTLPGVQLAAARLVASCTLVLSASLPARAAVAQPLPSVPAARPIAAAVDERGQAPGPVIVRIGQPDASASSAAPPTYRTTPGDSWWSISEAMLGDGQRWREVRGANIGREFADGSVINDHSQFVVAGTDLLLPEGAVLPLQAQSGRSVEARRGDHLWAIAERTLTSAWGRPPSQAEVTGYWRDVIDANADRLVQLGNPDLIHTGQAINLPDVPADPTPSDGAQIDLPPEHSATASSPPPPVEPEVIAEPPPTPSPPDPGPSIPTPTSPPATRANSQPTATPETSTSAPPSVPPAPTHTVGGVAGALGPAAVAGTFGVADDADDDADDEEAVLESLVPIVPGIAGATVLAGGLLLALRRMRRRRATVSALLPRPPRGERMLEKAIVAAADVSLVRWASQELGDLMRRLSGRRLAGAPVAVELSEESGIELLWDEPNPVAPAPWEATDGGWAWRLLYDPDQPIPAAEIPSGLPGLVTVGTRDGRTLLVDLEAYGSLAVTGDPAAAEAFVRAAVLELGASDEIADAYVLVAGLDVDGAEQFKRVVSTEAPDAVEQLRMTASAVEAALAKSGETSTFGYRLGSSVALEVVVAVARDELDENAVALATAAQAHRGVAAIIIGDVPSAGARLELRADGTGVLQPLGVQVQAAGVSRELAAEVAVLLDEAAEEGIAAQGSTFAEQVALLETAVTLDDHVEADWGRSQPVGSSAEFVDETVVDIYESESELGANRPPAFLGEEQPSGVIDLVGSAPDDVIQDASDEETWRWPEPEVLVRVLGEPRVVGRDGMGRRETVLAVFLACVGRPVGLDAIQDAVWGGAAIAKKTIWNLLSKTRQTLGKLSDGRFVFPPADKTDNHLALDGDVWTDYAVLRAAFEQSLQEPASAAMPLLRRGLELVEGPPFGADGYDWAHVGQHARDAEALIERTVEHLVDLALTAGDVELARYAALQGLRGLPGNEVLYRSRMRIEDRAGNQAALRAAYNELQVYLDDLEVEPSEMTVTLYRRLAKPVQR
jgi:nucleoid-associated protein YgaU/DNA-binding SARP family transcriptional activator